jgi:hypothetical protein
MRFFIGTIATLYCLCAMGQAQPQQQSMNPKVLGLIIMKNELVKALREICNAKFPQYEDAIEAVYRASHYSKIDSEQAIAVYAVAEDHAHMRQALMNTRTSTSRDFEVMEAAELEKRCSEYGSIVAKLSESTPRKTNQP